MTTLTEHYLRLCTSKRVEPFFGFIEHTAESKVDCDVDFVSSNSWSLFALALKSVQDPNLLEFRLARLKEKVSLHPPTQSQRKLPFRKIASQFPMTEFTEPMLNRLVLGLVNTIPASPQLKSLTLCNLPIGTKGATSLSSVLALAPHLESLSFEGAVIGDSGLDALVSSICSLQFLESLNLTACDLTDRSAKPIGTILKASASRSTNSNWAQSLRMRREDEYSFQRSQPRALRRLILTDNFLSDKTAAVIAQCLEHDEALRSIGLANNTIMAGGVNSLMRVMTANRTVNLVSLSGNPGVMVATDALEGHGFVCVTDTATDSDQLGCLFVRGEASAAPTPPTRSVGRQQPSAVPSRRPSSAPRRSASWSAGTRGAARTADARKAGGGFMVGPEQEPPPLVISDNNNNNNDSAESSPSNSPSKTTSTRGREKNRSNKHDEDAQQQQQHHQYPTAYHHQQQQYWNPPPSSCYHHCCPYAYQQQHAPPPHAPPLPHASVPLYPHQQGYPHPHGHGHHQGYPHHYPAGPAGMYHPPYASYQHPAMDGGGDRTTGNGNTGAGSTHPLVSLGTQYPSMRVPLAAANQQLQHQGNVGRATTGTGMGEGKGEGEEATAVTLQQLEERVLNDDESIEEGGELEPAATSAAVALDEVDGDELSSLSLAAGGEGAGTGGTVPVGITTTAVERADSPFKFDYSNFPLSIPPSLQQHFDLALESATQELLLSTEENKRSVELQRQVIEGLQQRLDRMGEDMKLAASDRELQAKQNLRLQSELQLLADAAEQRQQATLSAENEQEDELRQAIHAVIQSVHDHLPTKKLAAGSAAACSGTAGSGSGSTGTGGLITGGANKPGPTITFGKLGGATLAPAATAGSLSTTCSSSPQTKKGEEAPPPHQGKAVALQRRQCSETTEEFRTDLKKHVGSLGW